MRSVCQSILLLCLLLLDGSSQAAKPPRDYGALAYVQDNHLFLLELPNGKARRITKQYEAKNPRWSSSGRWLLFEQSSDDPSHWSERSMVVRRDGTGLHEVCRGTTADWINGTDHVAYDRGGKVWIAPPPDFRPKRLCHMPKQNLNNIISFTVSPDRKRIAFTRWWINWDRKGENWDQGSGILWVQNVDGSQRRKLYDSHGRFEDLPTLGGWSPDSRHVFMGTWVYYAGSGNMDGTPLYVFDVRSGKRRSLAPHDVMKHFDWYTYSPDKRNLLVIDGGERWGLNAKRLLVIDPKTWKRHAITNRKQDSFFPAWSPDGRRIAYVENRAFRTKEGDRDSLTYYNRLCLIDAEGKNRRSLTQQNGYGDWDPMWCGDGKHILFVHIDKRNKAMFWLIREDGQGLRRIPEGPEFPGEEHWTDFYDFWAPRRGWNHR